MRRLEAALHVRAERGTPMGSDELIHRINLELSGEAVTLVAVPAEEAAMLTTEDNGIAPPTHPRRWLRFAAAFATGLVLLIAAVGVPLLLFGGPDETVTDPTTTSASPTTTSGPTTTLPPMVESWQRVGADVMNPVLGLFAMARSGDGLFAIGFDPGDNQRQDGVVFWSGDGLTWSRLGEDDPALTTGAVLAYGITEGGPGLVAVGMGCEDDADFCSPYATAWTSVDGATWTRTALDHEVFGDPATESSAMLSVVNTGELLIAIGSIDRWTLDDAGEAESVVVHPATWVSVDGITWERTWEGAGVDLDVDVFVDVITPPMYAVAEGHDDRMVAVGATLDAQGAYSGAVWTSTDGRSWDQIAPNAEVFASGTVLTDVIAGTEGYVAVGTDGGLLPAVWTSSDGLVWSRVEDTNLPADTFGALSSVAAIDGGFVAGGPHPFLDNAGGGVTLWTSPDGRSWDRVQTIGQGYVEEIVVLDSGIAVAGGFWGADAGHAAVWAGPRFDPSAPPLPPDPLPSDDDDGDEEQEPVDVTGVSGTEVGAGNEPGLNDTAQPPGDDYIVVDQAARLPLGAVETWPATPRLDFLAAYCDESFCIRDAAIVHPDDDSLGAGGWVAGEPFHIRHGFVNESEAPLDGAYDVAVFVTRREGPEPDDGSFELDQTYGFFSDYVARGDTSKCGPGYWEQTESTTCEWFVHDFVEGLPPGRYDFWVGWYAPCAAWLDLGLVDACEDPGTVTWEFAGTVNMEFGEGDAAAVLDGMGPIIRGWPSD